MGRIQPRRETPSEPRARRIRRAALFAAGLATGLAIGPALGLVSPETIAAPPADERPAPRRLRNPAAEAPPSLATRAPSSANDDAGLLASWLERAESSRLEAMARSLSGKGLELVAGSVIDRLESDSLERLIVAASDFERDDLAEIQDVPVFARNLTRIAMEGTVREAAEPSDEILPIDFSEEITWDHRASLAQSQFASEVPRIYASFESGGLSVDETLAKWTRISDGEILLFERHRLRPAADSSFVYLDAPRRGFAPGEYRVDLYRADESLAWLASGTHRVTR